MYALYLFYNYLEDDGRDSSYFKRKLDDALRKRLKEIEVRRQAEESEKMRLKNMTKRQKEIHKDKMRGKVDRNGIKRKRKTLTQQERDVHQAYQLLVSEYHKQIKQRAKQNTIIPSIIILSPTLTNRSCQTTCDDNAHDFLGSELKPQTSKLSRRRNSKVSYLYKYHAKYHF